MHQTLNGNHAPHLHCMRTHSSGTLKGLSCDEGPAGCREGRAWVSPSGISSGCDGHAPLLERMQRTCIARLAAASEVNELWTVHAGALTYSCDRRLQPTGHVCST